MTASPRHDDARLSKKLDEWPEPDQAFWRGALLPGDLFEDGGARAGYSELSNRAVVSGYGRWLTWLERQGLLNSGLTPDQRIIPSRVRAFVNDLEKSNATQSLLNRLQELRAAAQVMAPHQDWSLIRYARVSTVDQNLALQRDALTEAGAERFSLSRCRVRLQTARRYMTRSNSRAAATRSSCGSSTAWRGR
jgi:hypothetical protein